MIISRSAHLYAFFLLLFIVLYAVKRQRTAIRHLATMIMLIFSLLLAPSWCLYVVVGHTPTVTATAHQNATDVHRREDSTTQLSTCGYLTGDPAKPRTADPGFNCRVDAANGVWGFCATTVYSAEDCFFPAVCVDRERCKDGCGVKGNKLRTFTW